MNKKRNPKKYIKVNDVINGWLVLKIVEKDNKPNECQIQCRHGFIKNISESVLSISKNRPCNCEKGYSPGTRRYLITI